MEIGKAMAAEWIAKSGPGRERRGSLPLRSHWRHAGLLDGCPKFALLLTLCAASALAASRPASAAGPPLPMAADTAVDRAQTQLAIQQAQAQARLAASQAGTQAMLNAEQARLEAQVATQQQAQLNAARQRITASAPSAQLPQAPLPLAWPVQEPLAGPIGAMRVASLTPQLGRYFGTDHGVLVVRAPPRGVLKLQDGDVILSIGGRTPASGSQAIRILASYDPGEKIRLVILRKHRKIDIMTTLPMSPGGR